jgi:hypothetical protein
MASLSNTKIKDTYQSLVKFSDNGNITISAKLLTDGFGNNSPLYVSTTQIGIGITPQSGYGLHVSNNVKIGGNLEVSGNLTVNGTLTYLNVVDLEVDDPLIQLAVNNASNILDIGLFGKYVSSGTKYKGLFNDASDDKFKLFTGLTTKPLTTVDTSATGYTVATLVANLEGNVTGNADTSTKIASITNSNIVQLTTTQTLTNKTLTSPTITGTGAIAGAFTGDLTGNVTGDITGDITGDVTGNLTGDVTGNVTGGLTGNVTGNVTGNLTGNVTGDVTGNAYLNTIAYQGGEGTELDNSAFNVDGIGTNFRWIESNSGATGTTWKKVADVVLNDTGFKNGVQMEVKVLQPNTYWGDTASLNTIYYSIAFRGDESDTGPFYDDALVYGQDANLIRVYKTSTHNYELQARSNDDNRDLVVECNITSKRSSKVTFTTAYTDGTITGGTAYTASGNALNKTKFAGNVEFEGAIFDSAEVDDLRVNGYLYLGAGADSTYGGYLTNTGATSEGIMVVVDDVDAFTINAVTGNGGEQNTFFKVDDAVKLYDANGVVLETVLGGVKLPDDIELVLGSSNDFKAYHNQTNTLFRINTGDLIFNSFVDNGDIKFQLDNGSDPASLTEYMRLDGGDVNVVFSKPVLVNNQVIISNTNAPALALRDSGASGQSANPYLEFAGSNGVRVGYIGMGSAGNSRLYLEGNDGVWTNNPLTVQGALSVITNTSSGVTHTGAINGGLFNTQTNTSDGTNAFTSRKWFNDDTGFGEIWRNSTNRSGTGQPASSFNIYNSDDITFWSGTSLTLSLSGNNASLVGNMNSEGYTINSATLQSFQDFQSKPIDTNSGMFTVGGHGMANGYSRAVSLWSTTDGTWKSWVGTNLRWDGTNYLRASNAQNENWGNIAGLLFWGNAASSGKAIEFIIDPPENVTGAGEATIGTSLPSGYTALTIDNDLSANFSGNVTISGTTNLTGNLSVSDSARFEGTANPITIGDGFGYGGSATICKRNAPLYLQYNNGQSASQLNIGGGGTAVAIVDTENANYNISSTDNTYVGASAGNFGVGETNPTRGIVLKKSGANAIISVIKSNSGNEIAYIGTGSSGPEDYGLLDLKDANVVKCRLYTVGTSYINGGNLVIGGTTTAAKFEVIGNTKLWNRWNSGTLSDNSFYVQNGTDGFAFGVGTGISSWFSWDNTAGQKRAIDVFNDGTQILMGASGAKVTIGDAGLNSALNVRGQSGDSFGNYGYVCLTLEHPDNYPAMVFRHGDNGHLIRHDNNNKLQIVGGDDTGSLTKKMQFETNGSVLIGTGVSAFQTATNNTGLTVDTGGHSSIQIGDGVNDGGMIQSSDNSQRIIIGANVYDSPTGSWSRFTADSAALIDVYGEGGSSFISFNVDGNSSGFPTNRLHIKNNGFIGLGNSDPQTNLHISKSGSGTQFRMQQTGANSYTEAQWMTPTGSMYIFVNSSTYTSYGGANATNFYSSNGSFNFHTNVGNNHLVIKNNGNIGINNTDPQEKLHIIGTEGAVALSSYYGQLVNENNGESAISIIGNSYSSIYFGDAATNFAGAVVYNHSINAIDFRTGSNNRRMQLNSGSETLSLYSSANVGHNYVQFRLANGSAQGYVGYGGSGDNTLYLVQESANNIQFYNNGATRMALTTSGYVGIGSNWTSPTAPLDVKGVRIGRDWNLSGRATIRIDSNGSSYPADLLFGDNAAANQGSWSGIKWAFSSRHNDANDKFYFYRGSNHASPYNSEAVLMSFTKDLKVGINQASPAYTLDVSGTGRFTNKLYAYSLDTRNVPNSTWAYVLSTATGSNTNDSGFWVNSDGSPDMRLRRLDGTVRVLLNSNTSDSYLNSGGNYAIGHTAPASRVDISGTNNVFDGWGYVSLTLRNENNYPAMVFRHGSTGTLIRQDNGGNLQIANGTTSSLTKRFQINANGLVSIGNINPGYTLDVSGTIRASSDVIAFSDKRVKENIVTVNNALDTVTKLRGVTYTRKDIDDKSTKVGVIAQEVLKVLPEVVSKDNKDMYSVAYGNLAGVFIEAIKELKAEVDSLKQELKQLKK